MPLEAATYIHGGGKLVVVQATDNPGIFSIEIEMGDDSFLTVFINSFREIASLSLSNLTQSESAPANKNFLIFGKRTGGDTIRYAFKNGGAFDQTVAFIVMSFNHDTGKLSEIGYIEKTTAGIPVLNDLFPIKARTKSMSCRRLMQIVEEGEQIPEEKAHEVFKGRVNRIMDYIRTQGSRP